MVFITFLTQELLHSGCSVYVLCVFSHKGERKFFLPLRDSGIIFAQSIPILELHEEELRKARDFGTRWGMKHL